MNIFSKILKFFISIRLTIFLLILLIFNFIFASIIPQNLDKKIYLEIYPEIVVKIILILNFNNYYNSIFFYVLITIFFINLLSCSLYRFFTHIKRIKNFGPDIIHLGLIIIIISSFMSLITRVENFNLFQENDVIKLDNRFNIEIKKIDIQLYKSGNIKKYITSIEYQDNNLNLKKNYNIEVNKPLKIKNIYIYQHSFKQETNLIIQDNNNNIYKIPQNEKFSINNFYYIFNLDENKNIYLLKFNNNNTLIEKKIYQIGDTFEKYKIIDLKLYKYTGLKFVKDDGEIFIFIGLIISFMGLLLFYTKNLLKSPTFQ